MGAAHGLEVVERIAGKDFEVDFCPAWAVGERPNSGEDGISGPASDDNDGIVGRDLGAEVLLDWIELGHGLIVAEGWMRRCRARRTNDFTASECSSFQQPFAFLRRPSWSIGAEVCAIEAEPLEEWASAMEIGEPQSTTARRSLL